MRGIVNRGRNVLANNCRSNRRKINEAFATLRRIGLKPTQQAAAFGRKIHLRKQLKAVKARLGRRLSIDDKDRIKHLSDIEFALDALHLSEREIRAWLNTRDPLLGNNRSPKEMLTGHLWEMQALVRRLGKAMEARGII